MFCLDVVVVCIVSLLPVYLFRVVPGLVLMYVFCWLVDM
jgi:hypothetical protein